MCARVTNDRLEHCSATKYDDSTLSVVLKLVQPLGVGSAITFILKEERKYETDNCKATLIDR